MGRITGVEKRITALPNARAALLEVGLERAWHDLAMKLHKRIGTKRPDKYGIIDPPQKVMFLKGLNDHFGAGTWTELSYDFHLRQFFAEIRSGDWRVRETEIVLHELPEVIQASAAGRGVAEIIPLAHLADRTVTSLRRRGTRRWRMRLQLDDARPVPIA